MRPRFGSPNLLDTGYSWSAPLSFWTVNYPTAKLGPQTPLRSYRLVAAGTLPNSWTEQVGLKKQ